MSGEKGKGSKFVKLLELASPSLVPRMLFSLNLNSVIFVRRPICVGKVPPFPDPTMSAFWSILDTVVPDIVKPFQLSEKDVKRWQIRVKRGSRDAFPVCAHLTVITGVSCHPATVDVP
jgi:hypothetical protein